MKNQEELLNTVSKLFFTSLDEGLSEEQLAELEGLLLRNQMARRHYLDLIHTCTYLNDTDGILGLDDLLDLESDAWHAPVKKEEETRIQANTIGPVDAGKVNEIKARAERQLRAFLAQQEEMTRAQAANSKSSFNLYEICLACATKLDTLSKRIVRIGVRVAFCSLFVLVIWQGIHYLRAHRVVATLGETVQAKWAQIPEGPGLRPEWLTLEKGYAQIGFKNGATAIIQAPCHFRPDSPQGLILQQGTVTVNVPREAVGFSVDTPTAKIVDYGTEFGVLVDAAIQSEIHVFKGDVGVRSNTTSRKTSEYRLKGGQNALSSLRNGIQVGKGKYGLSHFIRNMQVARYGGLPGKWLDLADLVGGGNGFGTGHIVGDRGRAIGTINPFTGRINDLTHTDNVSIEDAAETVDESRAPHSFMPTTELLFVDGAFVPDQAENGCVVSSKGHVFAQCPDTDGRALMNIANGWNLQSRQKTPRAWSEARGISMHANLGITFDLQAIRDAMPGIDIVRFTAQAGIPASARPDVSEADVYILVDGHVRFNRKTVRSPEMFDIDVPLATHERFLTLITTDGAVVRGGARKASAWDWCFFADPILELEVSH
jgi:hypothetical protein